jgi:hypothetical protein
VFSPSQDVELALVRLHALQRSGDKLAQAEIDRYLFACAAPSCAHLVLPRNNVPHYDNLPDISYYALGILDPSMDSDPELQQVLLLLRQCTPLRRRTKRAQREVQWRQESLFAMQTLLRCTQGTLLGLYPNCLKGIAFRARMSIIRFLRSLLVVDFTLMHACMQKIRYITKLCIMEHLCNTIYDFHPGICHTLNRSGQKIEHFCDSVSSICDIFRGELNTMFCMDSSACTLDSILVLLPALERMAHSYFERCTRAYRGIIIGHTPTLRHIDFARRLAREQGKTIYPLVYEHLPRVRIAASQNVFELVHASSISQPAVMLMLWYITQIISVYQLPACLAQRQLLALHRRYHGDTTCILRCRLMHVCIQCVIRKGCAQNMQLRHDCVTGEYVCMLCGPGSVLVLDLLGRIAVVGNDILLLSSCCASFIHYTASGHEFSTECGSHCLRHAHQAPKRGPWLSSPHARRSNKSAGNAQASPHHCIMCRQRNTVQTFDLLDIDNRSILRCHVCTRHRVPAHALKGIKDSSTLHRFYSLQKNKGGA